MLPCLMSGRSSLDFNVGGGSRSALLITGTARLIPYIDFVFVTPLYPCCSFRMPFVKEVVAHKMV